MVRNIEGFELCLTMEDSSIESYGLNDDEMEKPCDLFSYLMENPTAGG